MLVEREGEYSVSFSNHDGLTIMVWKGMSICCRHNGDELTVPEAASLMGLSRKEFVAALVQERLDMIQLLRERYPHYPEDWGIPPVLLK